MQPTPITAQDLLDTHIEGGTITERGIRTNVNVGIRYLASWLAGNGAAAIDDLMEDAATAEISRSQIWQWVHHRAALDDGRPITAELVNRIADDEMSRIREMVGTEAFHAGPYRAARGLFDRVALDRDFIEFLTLPAYELID